MSITVPVAGGGGGGGPAATNISISPDIASGTAQPGQTVTFTVTVSSGSGTPTGKVTVKADGVVICNNVDLSGGSYACGISFPTKGTKAISATYTSDNAATFSDSGPVTIGYDVGASETITTVTGVSDEPSLTGNSVTIFVRVDNQVSGGTTPTGSVVVHTSAGDCNVTLNNGIGNCNVTYMVVGWTDITATYTPADAQHNASSTQTPYYQHEVLSEPPTPKPPTEPPPTQPPTQPPTPPPTPVTGCNSIRDKIAKINKPIKTSGYTMYLDIPNTGNPYPVTISSVFVAWNFSAGHVPGVSTLYLQSADLNGSVFWTGHISKQGLQLPISTPLIINPNSTARLTFTFDQTYTREDGEQIQIQFSTPGCEAYPIILPTGSPVVTPIPSGLLKVQLQQATGGSDNSMRSDFYYRIVNTGTTAQTNISVRIYFTIDGTQPASKYVLERWSDQSGVATVSGPTLASGTTYYFTVSYGTASLAPGASWEFQTTIHLNDWSQNFVGTNDWWHTAGALPATYTDWTTIPVYIDGSLAWGSQP